MLTAPATRVPHANLASWTVHLEQCPFRGFVERALWGGFHADRLGYAFAAGYGAALARLFDHAAATQRLSTSRPFPDPPLRGPIALAATEQGGAHPRAIATRLDKQGGAQILTGEKTFVTLASVADELLVVASRGASAEGKNRLRIARVPMRAKGVVMTPRPETPFAPEIPHAIVRFDGVVLEDRDVLPGDGYDVWIKPFRTIEDVHVLAATVGYVIGVGRNHGFSRAVLAELAASALALIDAGARDPSSPLTHVVLDGAFATVRRLLGTIDWETVEAEERARWHRDAPLLLVAEKVRAARTEAAWTRLGSS
jgi:alkylation response protein AidB-like acyl-CoA dehydrogenase